MDKLTPEQCQAIIDYSHDWQIAELTMKDGSLMSNLSKRTFKQADFSVWGNQYLAVLKERVTKYEVGDFCSEHIDNAWRMINPRYYAHAVWITPLNDNYEGGELYFDGELIEQVVGVPIKRLRTTRHEIKEVTKNTRYSLVSWVFKEL